MPTQVGASQDAQDLVGVRLIQSRGDRGEFAELVRRHQGLVRALLRRLTRGQVALADELAQETFLRAWQALPQFRGEAKVSTWLYRLAVNAFLQHDRRGDARLQAASDPLEVALPAHTDAAAQSAPAELSLDLQRALDRLSEAERSAIVLCYLAEFTHEEAAAALGCPLGTLKSHVLRGRGHLREALRAWMPHTKESVS
jgi:RNA polymerase sigma-70 factor, ECF subfamily